MKQSMRFPFLWIGTCSRLRLDQQVFVIDDFGNYRLSDIYKLDQYTAQRH